jgi:hypothetical protein
MYRAEKVYTERDETWMIDRNSLTTNTPTSDSQQLVGRVPQEALQILAREIVREAGLVRDPVQEAAEKAQQQFIEGGREHWKAQVDYFKHMATTSGAALVAVAALSGVLRPPPGTSSPNTGMVLFALYVAGALFLSAAFGALLSLTTATDHLVKFSWGNVPTREEADEDLTSDFRLRRVFAYFVFGFGLIALLFALVVGFPL